jgi:hypothetical protein
MIRSNTIFGKWNHREPREDKRGEDRRGNMHVFYSWSPHIFSSPKVVSGMKKLNPTVGLHYK